MLLEVPNSTANAPLVAGDAFGCCLVTCVPCVVPLSTWRCLRVFSLRNFEIRCTVVGLELPSGILPRLRNFEMRGGLNAWSCLRVSPLLFSLQEYGVIGGADSNGTRIARITCMHS